jgi:[ribosomal protein S5]-alanine N-acetyltransferase
MTYKPKPIEMKTRRLILRDLREGDQVSIARELNDFRVVEYMLVVPFPYTDKEANSFVGKCIAESKKERRTAYSLGIVPFESQDPIGMISLSNIDYYRGIGTMGYWLGHKHWKRGFAKEALQKMIEFSFTEVGLNRIDISASAPNTSSHSLIKKVGFIQEGVRRQRNRIKSTGRVYDEVVYGLLNQDWRKSSE